MRIVEFNQQIAQVHHADNGLLQALHQLTRAESTALISGTDIVPGWIPWDNFAETLPDASKNN
jgi:hypothetical protein